MGSLLSITGLTVNFGGVRAVDAVDVRVEEGALVGLIGPNGAGKTTLLEAVGGFVPCAGVVELAGDDVSHLPPHRRARLGIARTWQAIELFDDLTVGENLEVAAQQGGRRRRRVRVGVDGGDSLALLGLEHLAATMPDQLSHSERKLVGVARALAAGPRLVCMDEPAAGLDTASSVDLGCRLQAVVATGVAILLVDHDMSLVLSVCDDIYVLRSGRVLAHGSPAAVRANDQVIDAYLGEEARTAP